MQRENKKSDKIEDTTEQPYDELQSSLSIKNIEKGKLKIIDDDDESGNISFEDIDELHTDERNVPHNIT